MRRPGRTSWEAKWGARQGDEADTVERRLDKTHPTSDFGAELGICALGASIDHLAHRARLRVAIDVPGLWRAIDLDSAVHVPATFAVMVPGAHGNTAPVVSAQDGELR